MDDSRIQELIDARDIENLMIEYFDAADASGSVPRCRTVFTEDAVGDFMTGKIYEGPVKIARALGRILLQYRHTSHHITNHRARIRRGPVQPPLPTSTHSIGFPTTRFGTCGLDTRTSSFVPVRGGVSSKRVLRAVDSDPRWELVDDDWYYGHPGRRTHEQLRSEMEADG